MEAAGPLPAGQPPARSGAAAATGTSFHDLMSSLDVPDNSNSGCVGTQSAEAGVAPGCAGCPNQKNCASGEAKKRDPALNQVIDRLVNVKHKILVLSGKGGVGKSTFSAQLSFALAAKGFQVYF